MNERVTCIRQQMEILEQDGFKEIREVSKDTPIEYDVEHGLMHKFIRANYRNPLFCHGINKM